MLSNNFDKEQKGIKENLNLYPNCDETVWLRTCEEEIIEPIEGIIRGTIPLWINGSLYRNGPGALIVGDERFEHLFDGSALLHRFFISDGIVKYQSRFLESEIYKTNFAAKRIVLTDFGTKAVNDPCSSIFYRIATLFKPDKMISDNSMISVYPFNDKLFAFGEGPIIHQLNKETLDVEETVNMYEKIGIFNHSAHPHIETDGSVYNLGITYGLEGPNHTIIHFPKMTTSSEMFEKGYIQASIPSRWPLYPSYMHTFGITENYFVVVEQPLNISLLSLVNCKIVNRPLIGSFKWFADEMTQFNVICRKTGECVRKFFSKAFFYFHIINQYEYDNKIIIDICAYKDASMIDCMYIKAMENMHQNPDYANMFRGRPIRFILPMDEKLSQKDGYITFEGSKASARIDGNGNIIVKPELLCDLGCETPRIYYEKYLGRNYNYFYAISSDVDANNPGAIIKVDVKRKTSLAWCEENCYPSEPIFVPNGLKCKDEDDGVILSAMVWGGAETNRVGLLILDAKTLKEIGRAEFFTPSSVPKCLHGWFLPK